MNSNIKKIFSVLISFILAFSINLIAIAENENSWKNKIDEKIYEEAEDKDSVIPVYIWLTDVDHEEVISETEKNLGYGEEDLAVVDEYISEDLAVAISNLSEKEDPTVKDELQQYMKKTEKKRKAEKEKTDKYISEKRSNYRDKYNKKSKDFLEKAKISDDEIIFRSQYAPMIIAELTLKQIEKVAKSNDVEEIKYRRMELEKYIPSYELSEITSTTNVDVIHESLGITGSGVKVGIRDTGAFFTSSDLPSERFVSLINSTNTTETHIVVVAKVFCGENGIAPGAKCYLVSDCNYWDVEQLISMGVSIINCTLGSNHDTDYYTYEEKWTDHIVSMHNVSFVHSSGNNNNKILCPGLAYNVIDVGGYDSKATAQINDDIMYENSSFNNGSGCEKPDLVAPAYFFGTVGTSYSAPFVSGIIALMLELRPSLAAYPQAIKAILLASCHHKAAPATGDTAETMQQGITDKQGAGVVDAYRAISITGRGNYGVRELSGGAVSTDVKFNIPNLYSETGLNVSIAWLKNNSISESDHNTYDVSNENAHNLNLNVLNGSTLLGTSEKGNSSTEMVYISSPAENTTYTIRINKENSAVDTVKVGYAWSFSEEQFHYADDYEGIYFIKNKNSGKYLNYSSSLGIAQKTFSDSFYKRWVVYKRTNENYTINNYVGETGCLDVDALVSGKYHSVTLDSENTANVSMQQVADGSVIITKTTNGAIYQLCILDNSTSNNAQAVWKRIDSAADIEMNQLWFFEPICYQVGDIDMDGSIDADDARTVLQYSAGMGDLGSSSLKNVLLYLADADSDGQITAADSRLILRISAGLE